MLGAAYSQERISANCLSGDTNEETVVYVFPPRYTVGKRKLLS